MVALRKAQNLSVWYLAQLARDAPMNDALLILDDAYLQTLVLWLDKDLMAVQAVKSLGCVLSGYWSPLRPIALPEGLE